jgi:hypothetical protein
MEPQPHNSRSATPTDSLENLSALPKLDVPLKPIRVRQKHEKLVSAKGRSDPDLPVGVPAPLTDEFSNAGRKRKPYRLAPMLSRPLLTRFPIPI